MKTKQNTEIKTSLLERVYGAPEAPLLWRGWERLFLLFFIIGMSTANAQIGIGTTTPEPSSILDVTSTEKGFLTPRLTTAERDAIASPAEGLVIYNLTENCLNVHVGLGRWHSFCYGGVDESACQNDITTNADLSAPIVSMMYDYDGNGTAEYLWCARELVHPDVPSQTWLDRNLGAYQRAPNHTNQAAHGDLYQWGRPMDGHQKRYQRDYDPAEGGAGSGTGIGSGEQGERANNIWLNANNTSDTPNDVRFIEGDDIPSTQNFDWVDNPNNNRWNTGVTHGTQSNQVCPSGYHVPTRAEFNAAISGGSWTDAAGALGDLAIPIAGYRQENGNLRHVTFAIYSWTSDIVSSNSYNLFATNSNTMTTLGNSRSRGMPVRCIKD